MGLKDIIQNMDGQQEQGNSQGADANVVGGVMQALEEHPGGLTGIIDSFRNNGMADHVQDWSSGRQPSATPDQVQRGLGKTGFIENVANKAGVSPEVAKAAVATILPMVLAHFTHGGEQAPPQAAYGSAASQILSKFF